MLNKKFLVMPAPVIIFGSSLVLSGGSCKALASTLSEADVQKKAEQALFLKAMSCQVEKIQKDLNENIIIKIEKNKVRLELRDIKKAVGGRFHGKKEFDLPLEAKDLKPGDLEFKLIKDENSVLGINKIELVNKNTKEMVLSLPKSILVNSLECFKVLFKAYFLDVNMNKVVCLDENGNTRIEDINTKCCDKERVKHYLDSIGKPVLDWHRGSAASTATEGVWCDRITVPDGEGNAWPVTLVDGDSSESSGIKLNDYQLSEIQKDEHSFVWKKMDYNKAFYSCSLVFKDGSCKVLRHTHGQDVFGCINFAAYFMYFLDNC